MHPFCGVKCSSVTTVKQRLEWEKYEYFKMTFALKLQELLVGVKQTNFISLLKHLQRALRPN